LDDEEEEVDVQPLLDALASVKHKLMEHEIDLVAQVSCGLVVVRRGIGDGAVVGRGDTRDV
jgi:hypothetical protein